MSFEAEETAVFMIIHVVAALHKIEPEDLLGPCRERRLSVPRQDAFAYAREVTGASYPRLGAYFKRDHTTLVHGVQRHRERRRDTQSGEKKVKLG